MIPSSIPAITCPLGEDWHVILETYLMASWQTDHPITSEQKSKLTEKIIFVREDSRFNLAHDMNFE